jgi:hypothetical protein
MVDKTPASDPKLPRLRRMIDRRRLSDKEADYYR